MPDFVKKCVICNSEFKTQTRRQVCSDECAKARARKTAAEHHEGNRERRRQYDREYRERNKKPAVARSSVCVICDRTFEPRNSRQITCSEPCRDKRNLIKKRQHDAASREKRLAYYRAYMRDYRKMVREDKAKEKAAEAARRDRLIERRGMARAAATIVDDVRRILSAADIRTAADLQKLGCGKFEIERLSLLKEFSA